MDEGYLLLTIAIITGCGALGGLANYYLPAKKICGEGNYPVIRCIILGIVASAITPLFLHIVSSSLIKDACSDPIKFLIFGSYCLILSTFSTRALHIVADKLLNSKGEKGNE